MQKLTSLFLIAACLQLNIACQSSENAAKTAANADPKTTVAQDLSRRTFIAETEYAKLLSLDEEALIRRAMVGQLGNCKLEKHSEDGCGGTSFGGPLYKIALGPKGSYYPTVYGDESHYCLDTPGSDLKAALEGGFCFSNHVPFEKISDEVLTRKAFLNDLGQCHLVEYAKDGCGGPGSNIPLFLIHLTDKNVNFPNMTNEPSHKYCLATTGSDLRKALNEGYCL